jgi:hypothetical protein
MFAALFQKQEETYYSSRHQIACFKATKVLHPAYRTALSHHYSVASFAAL